MRLSTRIICFILIPIILLPVALVKREPHFYCLYMLLLMAAFWVLDVLPYGITSFIPILFAPLMEIEDSQTVSEYFSSDALILCLGRLILACAFQKQQIHRRFSLFLLTKFGPQPRMIMLSCMIPSYVLTMFISNTATAPIMLEFVIEVLEEIKRNNGGKELKNEVDAPRHYSPRESFPILRASIRGSITSTMPSYTLNDEYPSMTNVVERHKDIHDHAISVSIKENIVCDKKFSDFSVALSLATGYAASCGAVATLVACGPNLVLYGRLQSLRSNNTINYGTFTAMGLPLSAITFLLTWIWVGVVNIGPKEFFAVRPNKPKENEFLSRMKDEKEKLGKIKFAELSCIGLTIAVIILWITRSLNQSVGWGYAFSNITNVTNPYGPRKQFVTDATPMVLIIILLYIWPTKWKFWSFEDKSNPGDERLLTWDATLKNLPWAIIFLLGTGFAIGGMCDKSGFSNWIAVALKGLENVNKWAVAIIASILACVTTEFLSSTTILSVYISIFFNLAKDINENYATFCIPLTLSSSFAFCLPAATTPNIAIFNRGLATSRQMIKTGLLLDIVFIFLVTFFTYAIGNRIIY